MKTLIHFFELQSKKQKIGYTIFQNEKIIYSNSPSQNCVLSALSEFHSSFEDRHIDFLCTEDFLIYGYISSKDNIEIIIGPGIIGVLTENEIHRIQGQMVEKNNQMENDRKKMKSPLIWQKIFYWKIF